MAKNKAKRLEDRWMRKRERIGPPGKEHPRFRPKHQRRFNYSDQLKMIQAGSVESTRERLAAERGELIVTLNLCGAKFFVAMGADPRAVDAESMVDYRDGDPPTLDELYELSLYFTVQVNTEVRYHKNGAFVRAEIQRYISGLIHPVDSWPDLIPVDHLVQCKLGRLDPRDMWMIKWQSGGKQWDYAGAQHYGVEFLYEGEGWHE